MKYLTLYAISVVSVTRAYQQGWSPRTGNEQFAQKIANIRERTAKIRFPTTHQSQIVEPITAVKPVESNKSGATVKSTYVTASGDSATNNTVKKTSVVSMGDRAALAKKVEEMRKRTLQTTLESAARVEELKRAEERSLLNQPAPTKPSYYLGANI